MRNERSAINCRLLYSTKDLWLSDNHERILEVVLMQLTSPERVLYDGRNSEGAFEGTEIVGFSCILFAIMAGTIKAQ